MKRTEVDLACIYLSLQARVRLLIQASLAGGSPAHTVLHAIHWCLLLLRLSISTIAQALWRQCTDLGLRKFLCQKSNGVYDFNLPVIFFPPYSQVHQIPQGDRQMRPPKPKRRKISR